MSRVLVTGASGFIGRALARRLAGEGHEVRATTSMARRLPFETVVTGAIGPETDWRRALEGVDAVVHLAARVHVTRDDSRDPLAAFRRVNVDASARLGRQAEGAGVHRFVYVSSVKAACETTAGRALTETDPPRPTTPYGISKLEGEQTIRAAARRMEWVALRPPLVYGPEVGTNFRALLKLVASGLPLPFAAVGNARSLIARDNLVDAIVAAIGAPGVAGHVFYVTDGAPLSTPALVRALAAALERPSRLFAFPPAMLAGMGRLVGRGEMADSLLGSLEVDDRAFRAAAAWSPPVPQAEAFRRTAEWFKIVGGR